MDLYFRRKMIYITGDTHGLHDFSKLVAFAEKNPHLTKNDYMIITGDFGAVWCSDTLNKDLEPYENLPFTVLFIDGNHENFDLLNKYSVGFWNGGKIHKISPTIIHLMRGQVFTLEGKTIFTFGGGTSVDKGKRTEGSSWWTQEVPSYEELDEAIINLKKHNNKVDIIITHSIDERALYYPLLRANYKSLKVHPDNQMLSYFEENIKYNYWYFGHYHEDGAITEKKIALYQSIILID